MKNFFFLYIEEFIHGSVHVQTHKRVTSSRATRLKENSNFRPHGFSHKLFAHPDALYLIF